MCRHFVSFVGSGLNCNRSFLMEKFLVLFFLQCLFSKDVEQKGPLQAKQTI
jgi:hypothetical protein